jgi:hypothetical protein
MLLRQYLVRPDAAPAVELSIGFAGLARPTTCWCFSIWFSFAKSTCRSLGTLAGAVGMMALVYGLTKRPAHVTEHVIVVLQAVSATARRCERTCCSFASWRESRDPLFVFFSAGFWIMSASWILLAMVRPNR